MRPTHIYELFQFPFQLSEMEFGSIIQSPRTSKHTHYEDRKPEVMLSLHESKSTMAWFYFPLLNLKELVIMDQFQSNSRNFLFIHQYTNASQKGKNESSLRWSKFCLKELDNILNLLIPSFFYII